MCCGNQVITHFANHSWQERDCIWTNLNLAPITLHSIKLSIKSLKLGISTKIEDTDQRWGLKNTEEKIVYERKLGKRSKVGMKNVQRKKLCTKYTSYWNCLSRSFLVFVSHFLAASHGIASYTLHGIKSCEVVPYFIKGYPISLTFQISLLEMKMKLESQPKARKQSEIILIRHHVIWYQSLVCNDNFL